MALRTKGPMAMSATPARARKGHEMRPDSDRAVMRCIELMTAGRWVTGRSHAEVAAEFGRSPETAKEWAVSASRCIRLALESEGREEIRARMVATLDSIVSSSVDEDGRTAVAAIAEQAKLLGLVEQRHKVDVTVGVQQYEQLPTTEKARWLREKAARLLAEADRLEAAGAITVESEW